MNNTVNKYLDADAGYIADNFNFIDELSGSSVLITGSTGLIGSQVIRALCAINSLHKLHIRIIAMVRSLDKAKKVLGNLCDSSDVVLVQADMDSLDAIKENVDYIVHAASPTGSGYFVEHPVETIHTAVMGTDRLLSFALQSNIKKMVYLSSLEVYGTPTPDQEWMSEEDFGRLDPARVRSSYSEGKRMAECLCASYASEYSLPVCMARLSQTFGPGVDYNDGRVFMEFTRCALEGRDIVLHTPGRTVRTYLYTRDAVMAILYLLAFGENAMPYNVTNRDTAVSILEMAELVADIIGKGHISVRVDIPEDVGRFGYNPEMVIRLDPSRLEVLGWKATTGLSDMFMHMADGWF